MVNLTIGDSYNYKNSSEILIYRGVEIGWHQFSKAGTLKIWAELLDKDLHLIEKTAVIHE